MSRRGDLLFVDDDPELLRLLSLRLELEGFCVRTAESAEEAVRRKGDTGQNLIELLERRLDAVVYRSKFVPTVFSARQFVNHGHIRVNGKRVNVPSFHVRDGDEIQVKPKSRELDLVLQGVESPERDVPDYIDVNYSDWDSTLVPGRDGEPALRLGLRMVKGFGQAGAERLVAARRTREFRDARDLGVRAGLNRRELAVLAEARMDDDILTGAQIEAVISGRDEGDCEEAAGATRIKRLRDGLGNQMVSELLVKNIARRGYVLAIDKGVIEVM